MTWGQVIEVILGVWAGRAIWDVLVWGVRRSRTNRVSVSITVNDLANMDPKELEDKIRRQLERKL